MKKVMILTYSLMGFLFLSCSDEPEPPQPNNNTNPQCIGYAVDFAFQTPTLDQEQTDQQCSNGLNDFGTVDKNGKPATWIDCNSHSCTTSPLVQVCNTIENTDATCLDGVDNPTAAKGLPTGFTNQSNGLVDCVDPSCFKNPRVTVCPNQAPKYELGEQCCDGIDNDGDGYMDCQDLDCLHANASDCSLGDRTRILFDNAHHQIAGQADWIIDVTGRHPFPTIPYVENMWHGSLSTFGKDLIDSNQYVVETLIQNRKFTYGTNEVQDLKNYDLLVIVEPSVKFASSEITALHDYVFNGGNLLLFADHKGADRDGNNVDSVDAFNDMLEKLPNATDLATNPFGFTVLGNSDMGNDKAIPVPEAQNHPAIAGAFGTVVQTGSYAGTAFEITNPQTTKPLLQTQSKSQIYALYSEYGLGRILAVGDSSIAGDGTNFLAITLPGKNAYGDPNLNNKTFLLNAVNWLCRKN